jgi:hypothetical protein
MKNNFFKVLIIALTSTACAHHDSKALTELSNLSNSYIKMKAASTTLNANHKSRETALNILENDYSNIIFDLPSTPDFTKYLNQYSVDWKSLRSSTLADQEPLDTLSTELKITGSNINSATQDVKVLVTPPDPLQQACYYTSIALFIGGLIATVALFSIFKTFNIWTEISIISTILGAVFYYIAKHIHLLDIGIEITVAALLCYVGYRLAIRYKSKLKSAVADLENLKGSMPCIGVIK